LFDGRSSVSAAFAAGLLFIHANSLHSLHRKPSEVSYKYILSTIHATKRDRKSRMKLEPEAGDSRKEQKEHKTEHGYSILFAIVALVRGQAANLTMLPKRFGWQWKEVLSSSRFCGRDSSACNRILQGA